MSSMKKKLAYNEENFYEEINFVAYTLCFCCATFDETFV